MLHGLQYLHEQGVLHRDIKGANILTTKDGHVKLADFGVAIRLNAHPPLGEGEDEDKEGREEEVDVVGSPYWMAPEVIEMNAPTSACDVWSLGCTCLELMSGGKPPYFHLGRLMVAIIYVICVHILLHYYLLRPFGVVHVSVL